MSWPACPECGAKTKCTDSRPKENVVQRRYLCSNGHRWSTIEQLAERGPTVKAAADRVIEFKGKKKTIAKWAKSIGISPQAMLLRIGSLPLDVALTRPKNHAKQIVVSSRRNAEHLPAGRKPEEESALAALSRIFGK